MLKLKNKTKACHRFLFLEFNIWFFSGCPQNHHAHHSYSAKENVIETTNLLKDHDDLPDVEQHPKPESDKEVTKKTEDEELVIEIYDQTPSGTIEVHGASNSSVVNENHTRFENTSKCEI